MKKIIGLLICLLPVFALAQPDKEDKKEEDKRTFKVALIFGGNAAQIDGDALAGYNKLGFNAGAAVSVKVHKLWAPSIEMLFSQKGSRSKNNINSLQTKYTLNYVEIPVLANYVDYPIEFSAGFSYARLLNMNVILDGIDATELVADEYKKDDFNFVGGVGFFVLKNLAFDARWSYSLTNILKNPDQGKQVNKALTFRTKFVF